MRIKSIMVAFWWVMVTSAPAFAADLTVAVAANVQYTFEELKAIFERQSGIKIEPVIGSSGKFTSQIQNGAPFDVFLSADMEYPQKLEKAGFTSNAPKIYGYGSLVLWTLLDMELSRGIEVLVDPAIQIIAITSPQTAPYGRQAVNALKFHDLYNKVEEKLVYGESIAQTNQFITTRAADIGITAKSIVLADNMKDQGKWIDLDRKAYAPIAQGVVILKHAEKGRLEEARTFVDFLSSNEAKEIFKKYGYSLP